jgi:hypothetical protein
LTTLLGGYPVNIFKPIPSEYRKRHKNGENKNHFGLNYRCAGTEESREGERGEEQRRRDPNENLNTLFESTQYDRESKGSSKNSEATRKEMLDEIKALLSTRMSQRVRARHRLYTERSFSPNGMAPSFNT